MGETCVLTFSLENQVAEQSDRYVYLIRFVGGIVKYVPLRPPVDNFARTVDAGEWKLDIDEVEKAISPRTKMLVSTYGPNTKICYCSNQTLLQIVNSP